jgi:hypothetical protein
MGLCNWRFFLSFFKSDSRGAADMTVAGMDGFNTTNQLPDHGVADGIRNPVFYQSVSSDADVDGDGTVTGGNVMDCTKIEPPSCNEIYPYKPEWQFPIVYHDLGTHQFVTFARTGIFGKLIPQKPNLHDSPIFIPNDFAVTVDGATHPRFTPIPGLNPGDIFFTVPFWRHNHTTAGFTDVAEAVLEAVQTIQPMGPKQ